MKYLILLLSSLFILREVVGPPVTTKKGEESSKENEVADEDDWGHNIEYKKYLKEVVQALESDPEFKEKLEQAQAVDIRTGKIARELEFVNHHVRTKLDELKRLELERLRHLAVMKFNEEQLRKQEFGEAEATGGGHTAGERQKLHIAPHLDHKNPHTFEVEDLRKLIVQTAKELEDADRKRREEFKQYELQKEYELQERLRWAKDEEERNKIKQMYNELEQGHKNHPQLHHPGSKQQLEEVWREQDHMNPDDFNPKTFFHLHDLDGNGVWDADEVKVLFQKELDKMYDPKNPEDDPFERQEELERMREHVFNESDTNHDRLISFDEFLAQTKKTDFQQDPGWEALDHTPAYTHEEYEAFERQRQEEVQRLVDQGYIPPKPVYPPNQGYGQVHPGQVHPGQVHPGQVHPGQVQYVHHGNQVPMHHPMASNQAFHAPPPHLNQPPQAYHPGQVQYHPGEPNHAPLQQQHHAQGYANSAGHHGAYQPVSHQGYPPHAQAHPQGHAQQGYVEHQPPVHSQQVPSGIHQGQKNSDVHSQGPGGQPQLHQQQPSGHQSAPSTEQQKPAAHDSQPIGQQHQVADSQKADSPQVVQHHQGPAGNLNDHHEDKKPLDPNAIHIPHNAEGNPSLAKAPSPHVNERSLGGGEQVGHANKIPSQP